MENNIDKYFRKLSEEQKPKSFPNMDNIWDKVEEKLDEKKKKRIIPIWKYFEIKNGVKYVGIAATLLLLVTLGSRFINQNPTVENSETETNQIVFIDEDKVKEEFNNIQNSDDVVAFEETEELKDKVQKKTTYVPPVLSEMAGDYTQSEVQSAPPNIVVSKESIGNQGATSIMPSNDGYINKREYPIDSKRSKKEIQNAYVRGNAYSKELQGEVSGVTVSELKDKKSNIIIRGKGTLNNNIQPHYVVDGKIISSDEFRKINPNDIEKYDVVKDASIITSNGTFVDNGIILIKTKKNKKKDFKVENGSVYFDGKKIIFPPSPEKPKIEVNTESYENFIENPFESAKSNPVSTFSIDVDNASYTNIRRFINNGQAVPKDAVRIEEMINFFKYDYAKPTGQHPFSINTEYSDAPWNPNHKLLRIGLQGKEIPSENLPKSNFVFLVDVSGSMSAQNKLPLLQASMKVLLDELRDDDRVSIVYYANNVGVLLEPTKAKEKQKIIDVIDKMYASGGTSGGAGLELAYQMAEKHFVKGGNNRIILATDGDFNIGKSSDKDMQELIEEKRKSGVFLTCLGFGMSNYKDSKMTTLSKKGNGNYAYIDNIQEANRFLGKEFKGSMFAIAKDVKIQIEFNPAHVQAYRLIGYEMRKLRNEDFTNDAIDAGELGSGHTVTALYEVIPNGIKSDFYSYENDLKYSQTNPVTNYQNELATVKFRYKKPDGDKSIEMIHTIPNQKKDLRNASKDFKFATAVAWFGLKLRDSKLVSNKESNEIIKLAKEGNQNDTDGYKAEFIRLVESVK